MFKRRGKEDYDAEARDIWFERTGEGFNCVSSHALGLCAPGGDITRNEERKRRLCRFGTLANNGFGRYFFMCTL